jgi:hypothetical protein
VPTDECQDECQEVTGMVTDSQFDLMWGCVIHRDSYPAELRGKFSFDDAYDIQFGQASRMEGGFDR